MTPQALRALAEIVEARKARDLARLERLLAEDRGLSREIEALAATATRDLAEGAALPLPRQGVRLAWADARIRAARRRREVLAEEIRAARAEAVRSLGKHSALEHLAGRADREELRVRTSRAEREAPPVRAGDG